MDMAVMQKIVDSLSVKELLAVKEKIEERLVRNIDFKEFMEQIIEQRFAEGLVCPRCGGKHIKKFGFDSRGNQRYSCKNCGTFIPTTKTVFANSKIPAGKWLKYAECMNRKYSLRKSAEIAEVSLKTAFNMRHKILEAIQQSMGIDELSGVVEMDETFFAESFKGNHKKGNPNWKAPRKSGKSRKRGKQVEYRGISHEQVCVSVAMDRNGALVTAPACNGRLTIKVLDKLYEGKIEPNSTICADSHNAYKKFADGVPADLIQIERGQHKKGIYHINNINSMHSKIKTWIRPFNGVATKYLGHYMYWFNWCEKNRRVDRTEKGRRLILDSFSSTITYTQADVRATKAF